MRSTPVVEQLSFSMILSILNLTFLGAVFCFFLGRDRVQKLLSSIVPSIRTFYFYLILVLLLFGAPMGYFWVRVGFNTILGSTHLVEQHLFYMFSNFWFWLLFYMSSNFWFWLLFYMFSNFWLWLSFGVIFTFWALMGYYWGQVRVQKLFWGLHM